jgi:hypothetical protein
VPQVRRQPPSGDNNQPAPLGGFRISSADERSLADYPNGTRVAVEQVMAANPYLIATFLEGAAHAP